MNMEQLFIKLPQDLQWEVLCDFAGTHAVRKGKLIRRMVFDKKYEIIKYMIEDMPRICPCISATYDIYYFYAISVVIMSNGRYLAYGEQPGTGETGYGFRRIPRWDDPWNHDASTVIKLVLFDDLVVLQPFVKHSYPTDKKKKAQTR
jgi:hypothetical protein